MDLLRWYSNKQQHVEPSPAGHSQNGSWRVVTRLGFFEAAAFQICFKKRKEICNCTCLALELDAGAKWVSTIPTKCIGWGQPSHTSIHLATHPSCCVSVAMSSEEENLAWVHCGARSREHRVWPTPHGGVSHPPKKRRKMKLFLEWYYWKSASFVVVWFMLFSSLALPRVVSLRKIRWRLDLP